MESFDKLVIARGNYACGELERALQYLELYTDDEARLQDQLPLLAEIYALLDEPDSVAGDFFYLFTLKIYNKTSAHLVNLVLAYFFLYLQYKYRGQ